MKLINLKDEIKEKATDKHTRKNRLNTVKQDGEGQEDRQPLYFFQYYFTRSEYQSDLSVKYHNDYPEKQPDYDRGPDRHLCCKFCSFPVSSSELICHPHSNHYISNKHINLCCFKNFNVFQSLTYSNTIFYAHQY